MQHWIQVFLLVAAGAGLARGDYVSDRKAARELVAAGKLDEALARFVELAESANSKVQQADAWQEAAFCAQRLNQIEQALEFAEKIPLAPQSKSCQMQLLEGSRRWKELTDRFQHEDIHTWPESVRGPAYLSRGTARFALKQGTEATSDLAAAADFLTDANSKGYCLNLLGDAYRHLLKDDTQAMTAYRRAFDAGTAYKQCQAAICLAEILCERKDAAAAVEELARVPLDEVTAPYWRGKLLCAQGRALNQAGRKEAAAEKFTAALRIKDLPEDIRQECERALRE